MRPASDPSFFRPQLKRRQCWDSLNGNAWQREPALPHARAQPTRHAAPGDIVGGDAARQSSLGFLSDVFVDFHWEHDEPAQPPPHRGDDDANPTNSLAAAAISAAAAARRKPLSAQGGGRRSPRRMCLDNSG